MAMDATPRLKLALPLIFAFILRANAQVTCIGSYGASSPWWGPLGDQTNAHSPCILMDDMYSVCNASSPRTTAQITGNLQAYGVNGGNCCVSYEHVYAMAGACAACSQYGSADQAEAAAAAGMPTYVAWKQTICPLGTVLDTVTQEHVDTYSPDWVNRIDYSGATFSITSALNAANATSQVPLIPLPNTTSTASKSPPAATDASSISSLATSTVAAGANASATPVSGAATSKKSSMVGPIVGGVIGGLALIAILGVGACWLIKRRQKSRQAPSAEFTKYMQQPTLKRTTPRPDMSQTDLGKPTESIPLDEVQDDESPPSFTPGHYTGPVFEKEGYKSVATHPYGAGEGSGPGGAY